MKYIAKRIKIHFLLAIAAMMFILSSCNKDVEQFATPVVVTPAGLALGETIATIPDDSLYYKLIVRGGMLTTINNKANQFTMIVPNNAAMRQFCVALGAPAGQPDAVYAGFISTLIPVANAASIVSFNMMPQKITTASIPGTFPNFFYPTNLNPTTGTPGFNPLVRLLTFPSTRNGNWINNIPLLAVNLAAANGVIHTAAAMPAPPQKVLAQRIFADADMTYLAAAINRADSGVAPTTSASLVWVLSNFGPNITVFAPTNLAFQQLLTVQITQALIAQGVPPLTAAAQAAFLASTPAVFSTPALYPVLTPTVVKGIVVYHLLGSRAFLNNFPTAATSYPTLLNSAVPTHPGVSLNCTFTGPFVSAATVKGIANPTASNILINPTPEPNGTSDQFFVNGVIHKIDQVLRPQ
ncbi:MAG: fasciclin domain-containing protein [Chitinophagaceae bacterium]|nr:fasciclin domain-containing protein [Chitinophagaceae bacterium]MBK9485806.1 fasciclin domain-containing protein [Chitinophagaceae bacterium]